MPVVLSGSREPLTARSSADPTNARPFGATRPNTSPCRVGPRSSPPRRRSTPRFLAATRSRARAALGGDQTQVWDAAPPPRRSCEDVHELVGPRGEQGEPPRGPPDSNGRKFPDGNRAHPAAAVEGPSLDGGHDRLPEPELDEHVGGVEVVD